MAHSSASARQQAFSPTVLKLHEDIWNDIHPPDSNHITDQDLLVFCKACFAFEGSDVQKLKTGMDHDMDGKVKRSDFEISMCQVIDTLWDEKESKSHINKTWDATEAERERFQQKLLKRFSETSQKISKNRGHPKGGATAVEQPVQSVGAKVSPARKKKLLGVIALTDEEFLDAWKIHEKWTVIEKRIDDEQVDRIWTAFLLRHEDEPLSGYVKQLPEPVLTCTAEDPTQGRELAKLELQARNQQRRMEDLLASQNGTTTTVIERDPHLKQDQKSDTPCRACTACLLM